MDSVIYPHATLVQFAREPRRGEVKTRLAPALGDEGCLRLHCDLVSHCFRTLVESRLGRVELWVDGDDRHPFFSRLIPPATLRQQRGADLGERMADAFQACLKESTIVVLVGSDCPFIAEHHLRAAVELLAAGKPAVIGPAADGGYYLIALSRLDRRLFTDMAWGTGGVLDATRNRLASLGWQWGELPVLADIDRPEDLRLLPGALAVFDSQKGREVCINMIKKL